MQAKPVLLLVIVCAGLLQGCALRKGKLSTAYRREILESWIGKSATELVRQWGPPDSTFANPDGTVVYVYEETTKVTRIDANAWFAGTSGGAHGRLVGTIDPAGRRLCRNLLEVEGDSVVHVDFKGERCVMAGAPFFGVNGNPTQDGLLLTVVREGSSAHRANLTEGMVLEVLGGTEIRTGADIRSELARRSAGDEVRVTYRLPSGERKRQIILLYSKGGTAR